MPPRSVPSGSPSHGSRGSASPRSLAVRGEVPSWLVRAHSADRLTALAIEGSEHRRDARAAPCPPRTRAATTDARPDLGDVRGQRLLRAGARTGTRAARLRLRSDRPVAHPGEPGRASARAPRRAQRRRARGRVRGRGARGAHRRARRRGARRRRRHGTATGTRCGRPRGRRGSPPLLSPTPRLRGVGTRDPHRSQGAPRSSGGGRADTGGASTPPGDRDRSTRS